MISPEIRRLGVKTSFFSLLFFFHVICNTLAAEKTVGVIMAGDVSYYSESHNELMAMLYREGYSDKIKVLIQKPYPDTVSLSNAARKLIAFNVDVIVAYGAAAAEAVVKEKTRIPLIYTCMYEPCSLTEARNVTGICSRALVSSMFRYFKELSEMSVIGVIYNSGEKDSLHQMREFSMLASQSGMKIEEINIKNPQDLKRKLLRINLDAIFIANSSTAGIVFPSIIEFSRDKRIPTASFLYNENYYATITISPAPKEQGGKAAEKVISILGGASPHRINADISSEFELVFNLKDANSMGLRIPMKLVTGATKLIQ